MGQDFRAFLHHHYYLLFRVTLVALVDRHFLEILLHLVHQVVRERPLFQVLHVTRVLPLHL